VGEKICLKHIFYNGAFKYTILTKEVTECLQEERNRRVLPIRVLPRVEKTPAVPAVPGEKPVERCE
jgi:hypothetical protein